MSTQRFNIHLAWLVLALVASPVAAAQPPARVASDLSLDQAVTRVQKETSGQVLSAESRRWDRRTEYRIKVLTPEGHVRVMTVPAGNGESARPAASASRMPPARHVGGKERH